MPIFHIISLDEKTSSMFDLIAVGRKSKWFLCGWAEGGATKGEKTGNQSFAASSMTCYPVYNTNLGGSTAKANLNKSTSCSWHTSCHSMENSAQWNLAFPLRTEQKSVLWKPAWQKLCKSEINSDAWDTGVCHSQQYGNSPQNWPW